MSLEEVLVEVEIVANCKLGDEGSQLGLLGGGERKISLRVYLLPRMETFGGQLHEMEVDVACKT
ncbi:hypothetical protein P5673_022655 [Acropora cervicornis]|uniref:Uncharacterized protein n=1 Tax=Acropora cervicornis TaxID=6130 RepID=A0AAD9UZL8_ACRCE|nr:hypothetical protein P5673_022655 [Acropora cervicornis]